MQAARTVPPPPPAAAGILGTGLTDVQRYAELLADAGVGRGLIGPREVPRLWDRHLLNCAVVSSLVPNGLAVDLGSGAGLPGVVLAVMRPDVRFLLLDAMRRRTEFLTEVVRCLGLEARVEVRWARAEHVRDVQADCVLARAVAPLDRLAGWARPLLRPDGALLALKGATAANELALHRLRLLASGWKEPELVVCGTEHVDVPTTVVRARRR